MKWGYEITEVCESMPDLPLNSQLSLCPLVMKFVHDGPLWQVHQIRTLPFVPDVFLFGSIIDTSDKELASDQSLPS